MSINFIRGECSNCGRRFDGADELCGACIAATGYQAETLPPDPECEYCYGTGERYWHSEDCDDDFCALNGDYHSCRGQMEQCPCTMPRA